MKHEPCVSSACLGDHCVCGHDWPCPPVERAIHSKYYDDSWTYLNHAGYDKERDQEAFRKFRSKELEAYVLEA